MAFLTTRLIDFQAHVQDKANNAAESETLKHAASQIRRLEDENNALRNEIKALKEASRERPDAPDIVDCGETRSALRTPLAPRSANLKRPGLVNVEDLTLSELRAEFLRTDKRYTKLHEKHLGLQDALHKSNQLLRERTTTYHQWVDHAKQLSEQSLKRARKIKRLEAKLAEVTQDASLNSSFSSTASEAEAAPEPAIPTSIDLLTREQSNTPIPPPVALPHYQPTARSRIDGKGVARRSRSPAVARSLFESSRSSLTSGNGGLQRTKETTPCLPSLPRNCEPTETDLSIKPEPSSDTPIVVSERFVRKRKHAGGQEDDTPTITKVKTEYSPKLRTSDERRFFAAHESIDFDTEYHRVDTPRKHTRYQDTWNAHHDADVEQYDGNAGTAHPINPIKDKNLRPPDDASTTTDLAAIHRSEPRANISPALQPLSNDQVPRPRSTLAPGSNSRKSSTIPRGLASIAEDGYQKENMNFSISKDRTRVGILEQLLETPSPAQDHMLPQPSLMIESGQSSGPHCQPPKRRELPFGKDKRKSIGLTPKRSHIVSNDKPDRLPTNRDHDKAAMINRVEDNEETETSALRHVPKSRLRLDDFKINPQANEGYDYAFTDVVRKKDDRSCLQGCIKENCCGQKFRALAHACRAGTRPSEFHALLESYLGDDCYRLSTMSETEKETLWVEAKTRELANASSKHRHRYPRMSTPPGFWGLDFPSTQEGEEYRKEAAKLEREIIEERYREAMRPGGLWMFRDE